ncbi:hypothetical protein FQN57_002443 [Myotisia sp. PD_48]|nr:hypothetical protein FQN57_002443 [Myotisia sp. PD_48]
MTFGAVDVVQTPGSQDPDLEPIRILGTSFGGTGCPTHTISTVLSTKDTQHPLLTVIFDRFTPSIGPDTDKKENRKNCQLNIHLSHPEYYQISFLDIAYRDYIKMSPNVTYNETVTAYYSGDKRSRRFSGILTGPMDTDFTLRPISTDPAYFSECRNQTNTYLNINNQVRFTTTDPKDFDLLADGRNPPQIEASSSHPRAGLWSSTTATHYTKYRTRTLPGHVTVLALSTLPGERYGNGVNYFTTGGNRGAPGQKGRERGRDGRIDSTTTKIVQKRALSPRKSYCEGREIKLIVFS